MISFVQLNISSFLYSIPYGLPKPKQGLGKLTAHGKKQDMIDHLLVRVKDFVFHRGKADSAILIWSLLLFNTSEELRSRMYE